MSAPDPIRKLAAAPSNVITLRAAPPHHPTRGKTFPPDPIRVDDVAQLLQHCTPLRPGKTARLDALRLRALIVVLYRTGVRISEAVAFQERDLLNEDRGLIVRHGKGDKRRIVLIDDWGWTELQRWLAVRAELPPAHIFPILRGANAGGPLSPTDVRRQLRALQQRAGVRRRIAPHQFRHGFAVENFREGTNLLALQRQLGHAHLGVTELYLKGIDPLTVLEPIGSRQPPRIVIPPS